MAKIEPALHEHFAKAQEGGVDAAALPPSFARSQPALSTRRLPVHTGREPDVTLRPFAKVNSVVSDSPADRAGLQAGDEVLRFGEVDWRSPDKLGKVAATTSRSEGVRSYEPHVWELDLLTIFLAGHQGQGIAAGYKRHG